MSLVTQTKYFFPKNMPLSSISCMNLFYTPKEIKDKTQPQNNFSETKPIIPHITKPNYMWCYVFILVIGFFIACFIAIFCINYVSKPSQYPVKELAQNSNESFPRFGRVSGILGSSYHF